MFKKCSKCAVGWEDLRQFLEDPNVVYLGYQSADKTPTDGLFLFNHLKNNCQTTMTIKVKEFFPNLDTINKVPMFTLAACQGLCKNKCSEEKCTQPSCVGNQIRDVITMIVAFPKVR